MGIVEQERAIYEDAWALPPYAAHSPGERYIEVFKEFATPPDTVLDAGCGGGKGTLALLAAGFEASGCDLTPGGLPDPCPFPFFSAALWEDLRGWGMGRWDWVYCTDVLEHLPPQYTMLAVNQMLRVADKGVFLTISTQPDQFGVWVGKALHQTVQHYVWWRDSLRELGELVDARDLIGNALFVIRRRP